MRDYPFTTLSIMWSYLFLMIVAGCQHFCVLVPGRDNLVFDWARVFALIIPTVVIAVQMLRFMVDDEDDTGSVMVPLCFTAIPGNVVTALIIFT